MKEFNAILANSPDNRASESYSPIASEQTPVTTDVEHVEKIEICSTATAKAFALLFGRRTSYFYIYIDESGWRTARVCEDKGFRQLPFTVGANRKKYYGIPIKSKTIEAAYRNGNLIGKRPWRYTDYLVLDIDAPKTGREGSRYHPDRDICGWAKLITVLREYFDYIIVIRSSSSNGYHIYVWLDREVNTDAAAQRLQTILETAGLIIAKSQLEIFPNVRRGDSLHLGIRFPCIEQESYVVNPNNLERIGWRETFLELSEERNSADKFLAHIPPPKPILKSERVAIETEVRAVVEERDRIPVEKPIKKIEQAPRKKRKFNLDDRFEWTSDNRSNDVIGAHVSYVIEQEGIIDPTKAEKRVWQRLIEHGYHSNASNDEQVDRDHVTRWISCRLKKGDVSPLGKKPGSGDTRLNENRSRDAQHRFTLALDAALAEDTAFESKNALFKWINSWLLKHKLATIGGGTWQKLQCSIPSHL
ncbi:MAG: hypothetical protein KME14_16205 [Tildeniella torsiva UHER 1998/13D]|nr:hypothetical protein [Tildeniella torsiva UHER 1998/13D]